MGFVWNFPLFTIVLSLFSSVLCTLLPERWARRWTVGLETAYILLVAAVLGRTARSGSFTYPMGEFPAPWGNEIRAGMLEALVALAFLIVLLCAVLGGWSRLREDVEESKRNLFFSILNLLTAALMSLVWTNDVFTGYVFLEIMTLASCGLIVIRGEGRTTLAAVRYMIMNLLGSGLFLMGVVLLYNLTGHLLMVPMHEAVGEIVAGGAEKPVTFALGILTMGLGIKSGLFPFYFWMPDTYGASTPTSAAVLSALVSKAYIFLLLKIYVRAVGLEVLSALPLGRLLLILGILGMLAGSFSALRSRDLGRVVAYSSAAQIGYIYMGLGMGTPAAFTAAMLQMLVHAVTKALLFLTIPRLAAVSGGSLRFRDLQGSGRRDKGAGVVFTLAALSMVGIPLLGGFSAKLSFATAAADSGSLWVMFPVLLALAASSVLNAMYFLRTVMRIYTAHPEEERLPRGTPDLRQRISAGVLVGCNLILGLGAPFVADLIRRGLEMLA